MSTFKESANAQNTDLINLIDEFFFQHPLDYIIEYQSDIMDEIVMNPLYKNKMDLFHMSHELNLFFTRLYIHLFYYKNGEVSEIITNPDKEKTNKKIIELREKGVPVQLIHKIVGCGIDRVYKVLKENRFHC